MSIQEVTHDVHVIFVGPLQRGDHRWTARFQICRVGHIICDREDVEMPEGFISVQLALSVSMLLADHRLSSLPHQPPTPQAPAPLAGVFVGTSDVDVLRILWHAYRPQAIVCAPVSALRRIRADYSMASTYAAS